MIMGNGGPWGPTSSSNDSHSFGYSRCTWSSTICKCREYLTGDFHRCRLNTAVNLCETSPKALESYVLLGIHQLAPPSNRTLLPTRHQKWPLSLSHLWR